MNDKAPVITLRNIGPKTSKWLEAAEIRTVGDLRRVGAVEAFLRVQASQPHNKTARNLMFLYALWGALNDFDCLYLPSDIKEMLKQAVGS